MWLVNTPCAAERIYASGARPEIEIFDSGDLQLMLHFLDKGVLRTPIMVQLVLGVRFGAMADPETLFYLSNKLPKDCLWAAFGIGRSEFPMLAQSWLLGGHVRVGLEDNVYISKGVLARDNAELVERGVTIVENLGGSIATAAEAREMIGLTRASSRQ